jgi:hypothetical protein
MRGLVRSDEGDAEDSGFGYVLEVGFDHNGGGDWQAVDNWTTLPFEEQLRTGPADGGVFDIGTFQTAVTPTGKKLTIFIRAVKKWVNDFEGNYDVDAVSLVPTGVVTPPPPTSHPTITPEAPLPETGQTGLDQNALIRLVASGILILVLAGGALLSLNRRRA